MSASLQPPAPRLRAPSWRDPRLVVGAVLVLGSVVLGGRVVAAADDTVPVWAARATLASGDAVSAEALTVVRVKLDDALADYLPATEPVPRGAVALRTLAPGELVPAAAVGPASSLELKPLGLPHEGALPSGLVKGARVDVWVTPAPVASGTAAASGADAPVAPSQVAEGVEVAEVSAPGGAFTGAGGTSVQVLLSETQLARTLAARAAGADVALVLVPGTTPAAR